MDMDMGATSTGMPSPTSTPEASMDHGMGNGCKISMLLNYNTVDVSRVPLSSS